MWKPTLVYFCYQRPKILRGLWWPPLGHEYVVAAAAGIWIMLLKHGRKDSQFLYTLAG